jgi:hypothetical protein
MTRSLAPKPVRDTDSVEALVSVRRYVLVSVFPSVARRKIVKLFQRNAASMVVRLSRPEHRDPGGPRLGRGAVCCLAVMGNRDEQAHRSAHDLHL